MNNKPNIITTTTPTKIASKMAGIIIVVSMTLAILFVGIPDNMNIAYAGDDSGRSIIDVSSAQGFKEIQNCGTSADGIAIWCV